MPTSLQEVIRYDTVKHNRLRSAILERKRASRRKMSERYTKFEDAEKLYSAYVKETSEDATRRAARKDGKPQYTTITIPYSYAVLLTAHTYWTTVFLSRSPVFQYTGRHGESQHQVQALEALIDYQVRVGSMIVPLFTWLMDMGKYGVGILGNYWDEEVSHIAEIQEVPRKVFGFLPVPGKFDRVTTRRSVKGYVGNKLFNVRPQDFLPDPRVSLANIQDGEYCGRMTVIGWNEVQRKWSTGEYFNVEQLHGAASRWYEGRRFDEGYTPSSYPAEAGDFTYGWDGERAMTRPANIELTEMIMEIIPSDFQLGDSQEPEKWAFTLAFDDVVIGAQPLNAYHNLFPYFTQLYDFDTYSVVGRGMLETTQPLQEVLDWLFNSHMYNVRRVMHDQFIADPSRVEMKDIRDGGPARIIRLRPKAYGTDINMSIRQLQVYDVTRQNIENFRIIAEMYQRITGVNDNLMGALHQGGRKTATEVRTSTGYGVNRLKTSTEFNSALGWDLLSQVLVSNSQQFMEAPIKLTVVGDLIDNVGDSFLTVSPEDINGFYSFVPVDGTLPIDRMAQANLWKEILIGLAKFPQLASAYDLGGIFEWMAMHAGFKNIKKFRVAPDEQVMRMAQAGDVVKIPGSGPSGDPGLRQALEASIQ